MKLPVATEAGVMAQLPRLSCLLAVLRKVEWLWLGLGS